MQPFIRRLWRPFGGDVPWAVLSIGLAVTAVLALRHQQHHQDVRRQLEHRDGHAVRAAVQGRLVHLEHLLAAFELRVASPGVLPAAAQAALDRAGFSPQRLEGVRLLGRASVAAAGAPVRLSLLDLQGRPPSPALRHSLELALQAPPASDPLSPLRLRPLPDGSGRAGGGWLPNRLLLERPLADGSVFAVLDLEAFFNDLLRPPLYSRERPVDLRLYAGSRALAHQLLYDSRNQPERPPAGQSHGLQIDGQPWLLQVASPRLPQPWWAPPAVRILLLGSTSSLVLALFTALLLTRGRQVADCQLRERDQQHDHRQWQALHEGSLQALDLVDAAVVQLDRHGCVVAANAAAARILQVPIEQLPGLSAHALAASSAELRPLLQALARSGSWQGELEIRDPAGEPHPLRPQLRRLAATPHAPLRYLLVAQDCSELQHLRQELEWCSFHDPITDLPGRRALQLRSAQLMHASVPHGLVAIGTAGLARVVNSFGHDQGDLFMQALAARVGECLQPGDLLAAAGAGEVVVLRATDAVGLQQLAQTLREALLTPVMLGTGLALEVWPSFGCAGYPNDAQTPEDLLRDAISALAEARAQGPYVIYPFDPGITTRNRRALRIQAELERALDRQELRVVYQPQVDAAGALLGAEALLRWNSRVLGAVSPVEFIPVAESTGLVSRLGAWVLRTAAQHWSGWLREGLACGRLAVNVSNQQFLCPITTVPELVCEVLAETGLPAEALELEITESCLMPSGGAAAQIEALAAMGIELAVDDFGTGFSSLSVLSSMPMAKLKIDRAFVDGLDADERSQAIVRNTVAIAEGLGMRTLAEGVERAEELAILESYGCRAYQGYFFAKPMDALDFRRWMEHRDQRSGAAREPVGA